MAKLWSSPHPFLPFSLPSSLSSSLFSPPPSTYSLPPPSIFLFFPSLPSPLLLPFPLSPYLLPSLLLFSPSPPSTSSSPPTSAYSLFSPSPPLFSLSPYPFSLSPSIHSSPSLFFSLLLSEALSSIAFCLAHSSHLGLPIHPASPSQLRLLGSLSSHHGL